MHCGHCVDTCGYCSIMQSMNAYFLCMSLFSAGDFEYRRTLRNSSNVAFCFFKLPTHYLLTVVHWPTSCLSWLQSKQKHHWCLTCCVFSVSSVLYIKTRCRVSSCDPLHGQRPVITHHILTGRPGHQRRGWRVHPPPGHPGGRSCGPLCVQGWRVP